MTAAPPDPGTAPPAHRRLDAGESACGELLVLLFLELRGMREGEVLHVVGYDRGAPQDIPAWCRMTGHSLLAIRGSHPAHFFIQKTRS